MKREVVLRTAIITVFLVAIFGVIDYFCAIITVSAATSNVNMSATINPSFTLEISANSVALDVVPSASGTFKASSALTVSAYTNSNYNCEVNMTTGSTSLTSTQGQTSYSIPTLTAGTTYTESTFLNDSWGYSLDATNYNPVTASNLITTFSSTTANAASVNFAAKLTQATKPGTYSGTVVFTTTCVAPPNYMQDMTSAKMATLMPNVGDSTVMYDSRDDQEYTVAKLADGKYWMTKNLNIAGGTALDANKTDVNSSYIASFTTSNNLTKTDNAITLPESSTSGFSGMDNDAVVYNSGSTTCGDNSPCYSYYSWDAATLGSSRAMSTDEVDAPYSICPKGWKLPTTYNGSGAAAEVTDFRRLMINLGGSNSVQTYTNDTNPTGATILAELVASPYNFLFAGSYTSSSFSYGGSLGYYWSATLDPNFSAYNARYLYLASGYVGSADICSRVCGLSVRCVFDN